jgi:hypothetical protein
VDRSPSWPHPRPGVAALTLGAACLRDLGELRFAALAFKVVTTGQRPIAVVQGIGENGEEHLLAVRAVRRCPHAAYILLFEDALGRGLRGSHPMLVDAGGCRWLERRIEQALGPIVTPPAPGVARG